MQEFIPTDIKSSPEARGKRLKSLRKMADLSRKDIMVRYRISASTIQAWEEAKAGGLTPKGAERIIAALRNEGIYCSVDWLLYGIGKSPNLADRLFLGAEEPPAEAYAAVTTGSSDILAKELLTFRQLNPNAFDMVVQDDGMCPFYQPGDIVAGVRHPQERFAELIGKDCIVETHDGEILLRRLRKGRKEEHYTLQCIYLDTSFAMPTVYDIKIISAATVLWHRRAAQR